MTPDALGALTGRRILVTGHTGFKGSWLTAWLLALGAEVTGLSLGVPSTPALFDLLGLRDRVHHRDGDVGDLDTVRAAVTAARPDVVLHLAAQPVVSLSYADPVGTLRSNIMGTAHVLQALREAGRPCAVVLVTSDKCYENVEWAWGYRETDALGGRDVYSASKAGAEIVAHAFQQSFFGPEQAAQGVQLVTARAGNVVGPGDWAADRIVADCVRAWEAGRPVTLRGPRATRPWQHVLEPLSGYLLLASRLLAALDAGEASDLHGEAFNFGPRDPRNVPVVQFVRDLAVAYGHPDPEEAHVVTGDAPFHEAGLLRLDCSKAQLRLRWQGALTYPEAVDLTGAGYRALAEASGPAAALDLVQGQIAAYTSRAARRGIEWAATRRPEAAEAALLTPALV